MPLPTFQKFRACVSVPVRAWPATLDSVPDTPCVIGPHTPADASDLQTNECHQRIFLPTAVAIAMFLALATVQTLWEHAARSAEARPRQRRGTTYSIQRQNHPFSNCAARPELVIIARASRTRDRRCSPKWSPIGHGFHPLFIQFPPDLFSPFSKRLSQAGICVHRLSRQ